MHRFGLVVCALAGVVVGCSSGRDSAPVVIDPPSHDAGSPPASVDAGDGTITDAGTGDAGTPDGGPADGGTTPDAGTATDAGTAADAGPAADAGTPATDGGATQGDAGDGTITDGGTTPPGDGGTTTDGGVTPPAPDPHRFGGLGVGPWPTAALTVYGSADGILEAPISASTDEVQNIWVVTERALYLLAPGQKRFHRYTAADGLHVGPGFTEPPDFTLVIGGGKAAGNGECFVGYYFHDTHDNPGDKVPFAHTDKDPVAHMGKLDQVVLRADGTLDVRRYDFHNTNDWHFYETRTIMSGVYDHVFHPGELYLGSNHGVNRVQGDKWRAPKTSSELADPWQVEKEYYADHVHPVVCTGGPCTPDRAIAFGDFFGLALGPDGRLWMGGLTSAAAIGWTPTLRDWYESYAGHNPFVPAFGDPLPTNPPIFKPPNYGDPVNIRAVAPTEDGMVWFASGEVEAWRGPTYGLAGVDEKKHITYYDPIALGAIEYNILEMVALPDGRLVLGFPDSGLLVWKPGDPKGHRLTTKDGLPGNRIGRLYLDRMVDPPALYVPTDGGLAVFRTVP